MYMEDSIQYFLLRLGIRETVFYHLLSNKYRVRVYCLLYIFQCTYLRLQSIQFHFHQTKLNRIKKYKY